MHDQERLTQNLQPHKTHPMHPLIKTSIFKELLNPQQPNYCNSSVGCNMSGKTLRLRYADLGSEHQQIRIGEKRKKRARNWSASTVNSSFQLPRVYWIAYKRALPREPGTAKLQFLLIMVTFNAICRYLNTGISLRASFVLMNRTSVEHILKPQRNRHILELLRKRT